ncbi:hypothetical protein, partial [Nocardiopsis sp. LOL_012]|uniref:hypothetical protein n=1 Tax=Nocardiopsis sp. LOL_012 TaxID=3345409 RepID=UPI003A86712F
MTVTVIIIAIVVVVAVLLLLLVGMRFLGAGPGGDDRAHEDAADGGGPEHDEAPRSRGRPRQEVRQKAERRPKLKRRREVDVDWGDDDGMSDNDFWSSLSGDEGYDRRDTAPHSFEDDYDDEYADDGYEDDYDSPEPDRSVRADEDAAAPVADGADDLAMLASLGTAHQDPPADPAPPLPEPVDAAGDDDPLGGDSWRGARSVPAPAAPSDPLGAPAAADAPLGRAFENDPGYGATAERWSDPLSPDFRTPSPSERPDTGSPIWSSLGTDSQQRRSTPVDDTVGGLPRRHDTGPQPLHGAGDRTPPSPYDTGDHTRSAYSASADSFFAPAERARPYETGDHTRSAYGTPAGPGYGITDQAPTTPPWGTPHGIPDSTSTPTYPFGSGSQAGPPPSGPPSGPQQYHPYPAEDRTPPSPYDTGDHTRSAYGTPAGPGYGIT